VWKVSCPLSPNLVELQFDWVGKLHSKGFDCVDNLFVELGDSCGIDAEPSQYKIRLAWIPTAVSRVIEVI